MIPNHAARKFAKGARQEGCSPYFGTSSPWQHSRFGEIGSPLRLQARKILIEIQGIFWMDVYGRTCS